MPRLVQIDGYRFSALQITNNEAVFMSMCRQPLAFEQAAEAFGYHAFAWGWCWIDGQAGLVFAVSGPGTLAVGLGLTVGFDLIGVDGDLGIVWAVRWLTSVGSQRPWRRRLAAASRLSSACSPAFR